MAKRTRKRRPSRWQSLLLLLLLLAASAAYQHLVPDSDTALSGASTEAAGLPVYDGAPFAAVNENVPSFTQEELTTESFASYSPLDLLGRCTVVQACLGRDLMPTEPRGDISMIHPTGWEQNFYEFVDGEAVYNRCHLIGFQLTGENANERNLLTGTRYMNTEGMLPFENLVADYIRETGNHVLYRVTPVFEGTELLARGVQMEALSVEDGGDGVCFNVYCFNVQPGVDIDYATGENWLAEEGAA